MLTTPDTDVPVTSLTEPEALLVRRLMEHDAPPEPEVLAGMLAAVAEIKRQAQAFAWDAGYEQARLDAGSVPYGETYRMTANPHHAAGNHPAADVTRTLVATSDGQLGVPAGQYLVRVGASGVGELAWRERPATSLTWSPPVALEVAP